MWLPKPMMRFVVSIIKLYSFHLFSLLCQRRSSCWKYQKWCSYFENPYHHAKIVDKRINFLVSPNCTLLFSRKEIITFFEAALESVHCHCLVHCIVIARGYRPWSTVNTADICLLIKNANKNTKIKCKVFFISHLATLRLTLGHWQGGSFTHPMLITTLFQVPPEDCIS